MPNRYFLLLSAAALVLGIMVFLFPAGLIRFSQWAARLMAAASDRRLMRYRYLVGALCFLASYGLFKMALLAVSTP